MQLGKKYDVSGRHDVGHLFVSAADVDWHRRDVTFATDNSK